MAPRKQKPVDVRVYGVLHHVVLRKPEFWACTTCNPGYLTIHPGELLLDGQSQTQWLTEPKSCSKCRQPAWTATPRGRAVHDTCMKLGVLPDHLHWQVVFGIAADLGAEIIEE